MSYIDWGIFGSNPQNQVAQQTALQENLNRDQQLRALSALHGVNVGDPNSVQTGLNALAGLGMFDQANALTNLAQQRTINQTTAPLIQQTGALYQRGLDQAARAAAQQDQSSDQQPDQLTPDQFQSAQQTMQAAGQALARVKAASPDQRASVLDQELQQFQVAGLDPRALANVRNHLNDANFSDESIDQLTDHYASHAQNFGGMAQGNMPTGPLSQHPADLYGPGTDLAAGYLNDPILMNPVLRGFGEKYLGINAGPGIDTAANLTANQRQVAAAGPQAYAGTVGARQAEGQFPALQPGESYVYDGAHNIVGIHMVGGALQNIQDRAQAGAQGANYAVSAPAGGRVTPAPAGQQPTTVQPVGGYGQVAGGTAAAVGAGQELGPAAQRQYLADQQTAAGFGRDMVALRRVYDLLPTTNIGPGTEQTNEIRSFLLANLPMLERANPHVSADKIQTEQYNELQKYMVQMARASAAQFGPNAVANLAAATSGNPHISMDNLSARDVTRMNIALLRANAAAPNAFAQTGLPVTEYPSWLANWGTNVDPRAFMLDLLSPKERGQAIGDISTVADKRRFLAGKQAAEQAGYFTEADIPR